MQPIGCFAVEVITVEQNMLPIDECTDEVITQVANTIKEWALVVVNGAANDAAATPLTTETKAYAAFVRRMASNARICRELEKGSDSPEKNASNGLFWFLQGWRAAGVAMESKLPKV